MQNFIKIGLQGLSYELLGTENRTFASPSYFLFRYIQHFFSHPSPSILLLSLFHCILYLYLTTTFFLLPLYLLFSLFCNHFLCIPYQFLMFIKELYLWWCLVILPMFPFNTSTSFISSNPIDCRFSIYIFDAVWLSSSIFRNTVLLCVEYMYLPQWYSLRSISNPNDTL